MTYKEILDYVRDNEKQTKHVFKVTHNDGSWETIKMGLLPNGALVELRKGARLHGTPLPPERTTDWYQLERVHNRSDERTTIRRNISKIHDMLGATGMWPALSDHASMMLALPLDKFDELVKSAKDGRYDQACQALCPRLGGFTQAEFQSLLMPDAIKGLAYIPSERQRQRDDLKHRLAAGDDCSVQWYNRRNNKVTLKKDYGEFRGWYSEERANKTDTRHYILLDEAHALQDLDGTRAQLLGNF